MLPLPHFDFLAPDSVREAAAALAQHGPEARLIAGGTDIVPNLKHRLLEPPVLISLARCTDLVGVHVSDDFITIGAMTTLSAVRDHAELRVRAQVLAEAAGQVASPQIQNMGTLGGNLCLDTRCVYYNQTHFWRESLGYCLKKDGTACHVVTGGQNCVAAASSDTAPALIALDASVVLTSVDGEREIPVAALFKHPGDDYLTLRPDEILTRIRIPRLVAGTHTGYAKLRIRRAIDFPILSLAATLRVDGGIVRDITLCATAMGSTPRKITKAARKLALGRAFDEALADEIGEIVRKKCVPLTNINVDTAWRRAMAPVLTRRLLTRLSGSHPPDLDFGKGAR